MTISRAYPAGWGVGEKLTSAQQNGVDLNATYALDKRNGQTDTLSSAVTIDATGSITAGAAGAKIKTATGGRIELGDNDYPTLKSGHTGRTVTRQAELFGTAISNGLFDASSAAVAAIYHDTTNIGLTVNYAQFLTVDTGSSTTSRLILIPLDAYLVNGSTITSVDVQVRFNSGGGSHGAFPGGQPAWMPRVRVARFSRLAGDQVLHSSGASVVDGSATVAAYENYHSIVATCDQNNVVDKTTWNHFVAVWNEGGTNALPLLEIYPPVVTMTITDLRSH